MCRDKNIAYFDITAISRKAKTSTSLVAQDGLHPSGIMYARWVDTVLPFLIQLEMNKLENALECDQKDPLAHFKAAFFHLENEIYLDGNSLGNFAESERKHHHTNAGTMGKNLIRSWNDHWLDLPKRLATKLGQLLNVNAREVLVGESTSVNLYKSPMH